MYGGRGGGEGTAAAITAAGVVLLPNTGGNPLLMIVSLTSVTMGGLVLLSSLIRSIAKRAYRA